MEGMRVTGAQMERLITDFGGSAPTHPVPSKYATAEQMERLIAAAEGTAIPAAVDDWLDDNAAEAISDWLDEHPEATTTVEDGSITEDKLNSDLAAAMVTGASVAPTFSTSSSYSAGDFVWYSGQLYRFVVDHSAGAWNAVEAEAVKIADDLIVIEDYLHGGNIMLGTTLNNFSTWHERASITTSGSISTSASSSNVMYCDGYLSVSDYARDGKLHFYDKTYNNGMFVAVPFYNSSKTFLSRVGYVSGDRDLAVTIPANAAYFRIDVVYKINNVAVDGTLENVPLDKLALTYLEETDGLVSDVNTLKGQVSALEEAVQESVTPSDTTFFHISKNMIDPESCVSGQYVKQTNGNFSNNSSYWRTDYVPVDASTDYVMRISSGAFNSNLRYAFYTSAKAYISGANAALPDMVLTSPATAAYIAFSYNTAPGTWMLTKYVNGDTSFESFDATHVLNKYIQEDLSDLILNIPAKVYALVGYETNIYFENITEKWDKFDWDVSCDVGAQYERGFKITPIAAEAGTHTLKIRAYANTGIYKEAETSLIIAAASAGSGATKKVIVLGDSTTDSGTVIEKLNANFSDDVMNISTIGTRGTSPNNHEGRSGWKWEFYFTKESITYSDDRGTIYNPFYNPTSQTFDADYYFTNSGIDKPDWFLINLGINDVFGQSSDSALTSAINTALARCEAAVDSILEASPSTKVGVCVTIPPNHSQDAFGKAYGNEQTRNRCKRNNTIWSKALIDTFDGREEENIYIVPINLALDTVYNMGMETIAVNARNTDTTYSSPIANGGVHPVTSGYWQIADVYTALIKGNA